MSFCYLSAYLLPHVVEENGGNHDCQRSNTEPSAHVTLRLPFERRFAEQSPEQKSQRSDEWLQNMNTTYYAVIIRLQNNSIDVIPPR